MLQRGNYGIEWSARPKDDDTSVLGRVVLIVVIVALISLACTIVKRVRQSNAALEETREEVAVEEAKAAELSAQVAAVEEAQPLDVAKPKEPVIADAELPPEVALFNKRPPRVRNLLMRLDEANKRGDVEMAATTIESIRKLPGSPAADMDDDLARRLGTYNMHRLFVLKSALWVATVEVKRGDSASRIASEHGSTLASLGKLNNGKIDNIKAGQKLFVLNHPRFNLVVHRRARMADLQLNGKFFKRYDLTNSDGLSDGVYEWREIALQLAPADKAELDMLLPKTTSVLISEL